MTQINYFLCQNTDQKTNTFINYQLIICCGKVINLKQYILQEDYYIRVFLIDVKSKKKTTIKVV
jgi:hypothetical protein